MEQQLKKALVIGANGYVAGYVLDMFSSQFNAYGIVRGQGTICKKKADVEYLEFNQKLDFVPDVIINTAYTKQGDMRKAKLENIQLFDYIKKTSGPKTKIIHLSTLVVFGQLVERKQKAAAIQNRIDSSYIESKLQIENMLLLGLPQENLQIVRIGNVYGPGSFWLKELSDFVLFGRPTLLENSPSNVTFIHNLSAYLLYLSQSLKTQTFHHLAEFSEVSWATWANSISSILHSPLLPITSGFATTHANINQAFIDCLNLNPITMLKKFKQDRYFSSRTKSILENPFLVKLKQLFKNNSKTISSKKETEGNFGELLRTPNTFNSIIDPDFVLPYNLDSAMLCCEEWLIESGYSLE